MSGQWKLWPLLLVSLLLVFAAACRSEEDGSGGGEEGGAQTDEGVTDTEIVLGNTNPYSGPASAYNSIAKAIDAYFKYVNEEQGGVAGRNIRFVSYDDAYEPPKTVEQTRRLVEQDQVFAVFNGLGTPNQTSVREYLNQREVPQIFVATGATTWGADHEEFKWTLGWQPSYQTESRIYAQYILDNMPDAKIAVLYQNDDYGKDYLKGLQDGLGDKASTMIVAEESYETAEADISPHVANLKNSGANVLMDFATPKFSVQAINAKHQLGWNATVFVNSVSAGLSTMLAAGADASEGAISVVYLKDPSDPKWADDEGMQLYFDIMSTYLSGVDENTIRTDTYLLYGAAVAHTMHQVLQDMGDDLTRTNLMETAENMDYENPFLLPDIKVQTSSENGDYFPIEQEQLQKFQGGKWVPFGELINASEVG